MTDDFLYRLMNKVSCVSKDRSLKIDGRRTEPVFRKIKLTIVITKEGEWY